MTVHLRAPSGTGQTALCGAQEGRVEEWTDCPHCLRLLARKPEQSCLRGLVDERTEKLILQGLSREEARELAIELEVAEFLRVPRGSVLKT